MRIVRGTAAVLLVVAGCATSASESETEIPLPPRADLPEGGDATLLKVDAGGDGGERDAATEAEAGPAGPIVFVSSTTTVANTGGLTGADARCAGLATAAGLGGAWVAWLSNGPSGPHAADRVTSAGPWYLRSGEMVALNKIELVSGTLRHAIDRDESGAQVAASRVWTGSGTNGRYLTNDCDKWTTGTNGRVGDSSATGAAWTTAGVDGCGQQRRLYCFQN
ncbi:MAG: hypothetical protein KF819_02225 [Labilithrix sp.]|nr:hypothetical protein [Labilithrix sp.]